MRQEPFYFGNDLGTGSNSAGHRLFSGDSRGIDARNMFEYVPGVGYGMDEVKNCSFVCSVCIWLVASDIKYCIILCI
jgi:hypothetical protein